MSTLTGTLYFLKFSTLSRTLASAAAPFDWPDADCSTLLRQLVTLVAASSKSALKGCSRSFRADKSRPVVFSVSSVALF